MEETNAKNENEFVAFLGIDWADERHAWALQTSAGVEHGILAHTPEAVEAWAAELQCRFAGGLIAVALEQSRAPLLFGVHQANQASFTKAVASESAFSATTPVAPSCQKD